ncbi:hypothetical protein [Fibrobacter sp. HC4]|uniref:hypothetical protein n=1 Tax=Fibrobacter sp. HC4 TaxID=3239812 RepID=UPI002018549F|nr:hypothetical protein [Fibrobacter succinogenes]MCL4101871.1 hypothetical protein [Fibrobacter succinogenes]
MEEKNSRNEQKQIKISKRIKKVASGLLISAFFVFIILIFGSTQNDITGMTRNGAESLENIFEASSTCVEAFRQPC